MSLVFSDVTTKKGIIQEIESELGFNDGDISGNTVLLKKFTALVNLAFDDFLFHAFGSESSWQFDDSNHTDFPFITTNLVSGQRDYTFVTDDGGNLILDVYRVMVADSGGTYREIYPVDQNIPNRGDINTDSFIDGQNLSGIPTRYDKTANGILLDVIPNYNYTNGLKVFINREPSYFLYTDTSKKPGVPGTLHRYFVIKPAHDYARRNNLANAQSLAEEVFKYEGDETRGIAGKIGKTFARRQKDVRNRLTANIENNR